MTALWSVVFLIACIVGSTMLSRWATGAASQEGTVSRWLTWTCLFFSAFFGSFYVLGYLNLATDLPVVDSSYAAIVAVVVFSGLGLWMHRTDAARFKRGMASGQADRAGISLRLPGNRLVRGLAAATFLVFVSTAFMLSAGFPSGYESQGYHLPVAVHIFQAHSLKVWTVWQTTFIHTYPANASIFFGFLLRAAPEHLVAAANMVFLIPLAVAGYGIGRATGADKTASLLATLGLVTIPVLVLPALEAAADIGGAAFLAIAIYFIVAQPGIRVWHLVLGGLAAGLAFGFKSLHLIGIGFLFMTIVLRSWSQPSDGRLTSRLQRTAAASGVFLAAVLASCGFWLVRNYVQLGNPLYPVYVSIFAMFGWTKSLEFSAVSQSGMQARWVRSSAEWLIYPWIEWLRLGQEFNNNKPGLGPFFATTVPVACLMTLVEMVTGRDRKRLVISTLLMGGLFVLAVWWTLDDRQPRYFIGALVFLVPLVAWTISLTTGVPRKVFEVLVACSISSALLMTFSTHFIDFGSRFIYGRQFERWAFFQYPDVLDRLPPGSTVINLGHRTRNYSLVGRTHQNRVVVYTEAFSALRPSLGAHSADEAPQVIPLSHVVLRALGATHLLTEGSPEMIPDECVSLRRIGRLDTDTLGNRLPAAIELFEITLCN